MHCVNKSVDADSYSFRVSTGRLGKCVQQNQGRAQRWKYGRESLNYHLPKITSYSPVSDCNYKIFEISRMMESIPKKSITARNGKDCPSLPGKEEISSKLSTYAILPPVRKPGELTKDLVEKEFFKGLGCVIKEYRRKVFLPVLHEHKMRNNERCRDNKEFHKPKEKAKHSSQLPLNPTSIPPPSLPPPDDYALIPWDHTDSQDNSQP